MNIQDIKNHKTMNDVILEKCKIITDLFENAVNEKLQEYLNPNNSYNINVLLGKYKYRNPFNKKLVVINEVTEDGVVIHALELNSYDWDETFHLINSKYIEMVDYKDSLKSEIKKEVEAKFGGVDDEYNALIEAEKQYKLEQDERDRVFIEEMKKKFQKDTQ